MNQFSSIFGQILQIFPKTEFYSAVKETRSEKGAKGFACWGQFVAMLFCQLGQARSLREITGGLSSYLGKLRHLGIESAPSRSTLAYANEKRPWQLYEQVFYQLLGKCAAIAPGKKFRFKNKLVQSGSLRDRPLRFPFRLGHLPPDQGRGQAPSPARPRRLSPCLCPYHGRQRP